MIIRRCVPETEKGEILDKCHASPYGGHFVGERMMSAQNTHHIPVFDHIFGLFHLVISVFI